MTLLDLLQVQVLGLAGHLLHSGITGLELSLEVDSAGFEAWCPLVLNPIHFALALVDVKKCSAQKEDAVVLVLLWSLVTVLCVTCAGMKECSDAMSVVGKGGKEIVICICILTPVSLVENQFLTLTLAARLLLSVEGAMVGSAVLVGFPRRICAYIVMRAMLLRKQAVWTCSLSLPTMDPKSLRAQLNPVLVALCSSLPARQGLAREALHAARHVPDPTRGRAQQVTVPRVVRNRP
jgi:hypothetical protein